MFSAAFEAAKCAECERQWISNKFGTFYFNLVKTELFFPLITFAPSDANPIKFSHGI